MASRLGAIRRAVSSPLTFPQSPDPEPARQRWRMTNVMGMAGRFPIEDVAPSVACRRYPAKAVVGELVPVSARSYREGHAALGCNVVLRAPDGREGPFTRMRKPEPDEGTDIWYGSVRPDAVGAWTFTVEAFGDPYLTWRNAVVKKIDAGQGAEDLANDLDEAADIRE